MRTNIVLNDELVEAAMAHAKARTKRELIEEVLRAYVDFKEAEKTRRSYADRVQKIRERAPSSGYGISAHELIRKDRQRT